MEKTLLALSSPAARWLKSSFVMFACVIANTASAKETIIKTSLGSGADAEVRKNGNEVKQKHDSGHGNSEVLNVRFDPTFSRERNEIVLLRFDLSSLKPSQIANAKLELTAYSSFHKNRIQVYGLKHIVKNQNWSEATIKFSSAPGLKWNGDDLTTRDLIQEDVTKLGVMNVPRPEEGMVLGFTSAQLTRFLQDETRATRKESPNLVTLILMLDEPSRGQRRFRSKEFPDQDDADAPRLVLLTR